MPTPSLAVILRRMRATREAAQGALRQTDDLHFVSGLIHTASLWYDANAAGANTGGHAGRPGDPQPVGGFEEVACLIVFEGVVPTEGEGRPGSMRVGTVLFGHEVPADRRHFLLFDAPTFGKLRLHLRGPVVDEHGMGHHWFVEFQDRPL